VNKWLIPALTAVALLSGCATEQRGSIPVEDSGSKVSNSERVQGNGGYRQSAPQQQQQQQPQADSQDSGVTVMVPGGGGAPIQSYPASTGAPQFNTSPIDTAPINTAPIDTAPVNTAPINNSYNSTAPTGIPSSGGGLSADEQLDGPVLSLLTTAQQQQASGDLNGASSSLERAQRVAPREPQVLFRLAQVRLSQGDAPQAEQLARRALTYANGRPDLQASLWGLIAQCRAKQGDAAGAASARQKAGTGS
jgi:hypothetical protein